MRTQAEYVIYCSAKRIVQLNVRYAATVYLLAVSDDSSKCRHPANVYFKLSAWVFYKMRILCVSTWPRMAVDQNRSSP